MNDTINELEYLYDFRSDILYDINDLSSYFVNKNGFIIFNLNIRSITKVFSHLLVMLNNTLQFIDCIILTECRINYCAIK